MRGRLYVLASGLALALLAAGVALAGNGGIAPPDPQSPNAERISDAYWLILAITGGIFVLVEGALLFFILRYRGRGRSRGVEGPQIRGHARLELIWTVIPVLLLAGIASFVFYKLPGIDNIPAASASGGRENIRVVAHQFYWEFRYPNGAISIDELRAPVDRVVRMEITSEDVIHSWWIPQLGGKFDAVPRMTNETWFRARRTGTFKGQCGEFCGIYHAIMNARVRVTSQAEYEDWVTTGARAQLGRSLWEGVCAKCHGPQGEGEYGPQIAGNPSLIDEAALKTLLRNGRNSDQPGVMPPVGKNWTDAEYDALIQYVQRNVRGGG